MNGVQVYAPIHWLDANLQQQRKKRSTSSLEKDFPGSKFTSIAAPTICWSFIQAGSEYAMHIKNQNLVFELSILVAYLFFSFEIFDDKM